MQGAGRETGLGGSCHSLQGTDEPPSCPGHIPPGVPLTVAPEKPVEGGLLATPTELLGLVHQCLLHGLLPAQHHHTPGPQVDGEHGAIAFADLTRVRWSGALGLEGAAPTHWF